MSRIFVLFLAVALIFGAAGCAKNKPTFNAKYYPECYDPIEKLCKDQSYNEEVKGAATGALLGALGGAIVGGITSGSWRGAAIGAAAGGVAGAVTGFFAAHLNKIENQNKRLEEYQRLLGEKSDGWDIERATVERSLQCYVRQAELLKNQYKAGQISKAAMLERLREIQAGIQYVNTYWASAESRIDDTLADGDKFLAEEDQKVQKEAIANRAKSQKAVAAARKKSQTKASDVRKKNRQTKKMGDDADAMVAALIKEVDTESGHLALFETDGALMCMAAR